MTAIVEDRVYEEIREAANLAIAAGRSPRFYMWQAAEAWRSVCREKSVEAHIYFKEMESV